jgi:hypothetical protein
VKKIRVTNVTKEAIILEEGELADTFWARLKGLLGKKELPAGKGIVIKPCSSIHTFGMAFPIDVAFVDKKDSVCYILEAMPSYRLSPLVRKASYVIEAPPNTFKKTGTVLGDRMKLEEI